MNKPTTKRGYFAAKQFAAGLVAGSATMVALFGLGLDVVYQMSWGLAVTVGVWAYLEPRDESDFEQAGENA